MNHGNQGRHGCDEKETCEESREERENSFYLRDDPCDQSRWSGRNVRARCMEGRALIGRQKGGARSPLGSPLKRAGGEGARLKGCSGEG